MSQLNKRQTVELVESLSDVEIADLEQHELTIRRGIQKFVDVGKALLAIRDGKLYREQHATFEIYCRDRWEFGRIHAYRLIEAADVVKTLSPMGDMPSNERQTRPLAKLAPEEREAAWESARHKANQMGRPVTAAVAEEVVNERISEAEPKTKVRLPVAIGLRKARKAISALNEIPPDDAERAVAFATVGNFIREQDAAQAANTGGV